MNATEHVITRQDRIDCDQYVAEIHGHINSANDHRDKARTRFSEIVERKLYLIYADTAEEFALQEFGKSRSWLYQQIEIEKAQDSLPDDLSTHIDTLPKARELQKVPKKRRMGVIASIVEQEKNVTPQAIREAAKPPPKPHVNGTSKPQEIIDVKPVVRDATGYEIPEQRVEQWEKLHTTGKEILTRVSSLRGAIRRAEENKDPQYAFISFSTTMTDLNRLYSELAMIIPYAVCPTCQGQVSEKCRLCRTTGFVPKHIWDHAVPSDLKQVRQRGIEQKKK